MSRRTPRIWRKKRGGKHYGAWIATIDGADVSLATKNAELARQRLPAALKGARTFESDAAAAAAASEPGLEELGAPDLAAAQGTNPVGAPSSPAPAVVMPDQVISPPLVDQPPANNQTDADAEAEATQAAAEQVAGGASSAEEAPEGFDLPPDAIRGFLKQGGVGIVLMQLELQAWIIKKRTGKICQPLTGERAQKMIDAGGDAWIAQLEKWFPDIEQCPPWFIAVGAPLLLLPAQLATAVDDPEAKKPEKPGDPTPAQVAA